ncbi:DNA polymerase III subunit delta [bacterium]|nr:DNA polymerase III subunit delta [bacterium]
MIFFLFGEDNYRSQKKINEIKNKFLESVKNSRNSLSYINGENTNLNEINEKFSLNSLFSEKKIIIIKNILQNTKQDFLESFLNYFKNNNLEKSENAIIFFEENKIEEKKLKKEHKKIYSILKKQKFVQEFKPLNPSQLNIYIKKEFEKYSKIINFQAINELNKNIGNDLWLMSNEIHKIAHSTKEKEITSKELKRWLNNNIEENIFSLTDAWGKKKIKKALIILEEQIKNGLPPEYVLAILKKHFQKLLQSKMSLGEGLYESDISKKFSWHPFATKKLLEQSRNFNNQELKIIINKLNKLDFLNKTSSSNLLYNLEILLNKKL